MRKFLVQFIVIFLIHLIIKAGDYTFGNFFDFTRRGILFSTFFISYALIIWNLSETFNHYFLKKYERQFDNNKVFNSLFFLIHFIYGFIASFILNYLYRQGDILLYDMREAWDQIPLLNPELTLSLLTMYMMFFTLSSYSYINLKRKEDQLKLEKLKQENTLAQYLNLKSQIEPHFLFNSLSVLSSIIHTEPDLASNFTLRLSKILRFVIEKNELNLISLKEELEFVHNYLFLIQTRFETGIKFQNKLDLDFQHRCCIPPSSIQSLVENAIKHNKFTKDNPITINLEYDEEYIHIRNNLNKRDDFQTSTQQGLKNLKQRFSYFSDKAVLIQQSDDFFSVYLPILDASKYECSTI